MQYCSLKHWTLLPSPVTSTTGCCFWFGSVSSFFLELFLHWSPVACWEPTDLGSFFQCHIFFIFIMFMVFSRQEYWRGLLFPSPVDHILSELSTMTCLPWGSYTVGPILYMAVCIYIHIQNSQFISPLLSPLITLSFFLCLWVYFYFMNRLISMSIHVASNGIVSFFFMVE